MKGLWAGRGDLSRGAVQEDHRAGGETQPWHTAGLAQPAECPEPARTDARTTQWGWSNTRSLKSP